ncbi:hypothetical protein BDZ97DRAFT_1754705 [Flammula alnicola]|nr:hypothetical protein BDZ97DRAFT_1754705 [Flammula alnicola]
MSPCCFLNFASQAPDITSGEFFSGYADQSDLVQHVPVRSSLDMLSSMAHNDERPSRKLKSENRLYNFLTRSRSRSRSKNEQPAPESTTNMPDLPSTPRAHSRTQNTHSPGSKPASRIPSRPLSSTTTATNTTVTPGTPKPRKQRPQTTSIPAPAPTVERSPPSSSRPTTPKPSGARQKLHDLFGIHLGRKSTSRSRSRSRPSSPVGGPLRASLDVPPLPTAGVDDDTTPRPRKSLAPQISRPRSPSPTPQPKVLRVTNATTTSSSTGSTAASIKISKFFTKGSTPAPDPNRMPRPSTAGAKPSGGPPVLPPIPSLVSGPLKRVSSLHRRSLKDPLPDPPLAQTPTQRSGPSPPPKIIHTPPTPLKSANTSGSGSASGSGSSSKGSSAQPSVTSARLGYHAAKGSLDSSYRYRGGGPAMGVVDEEGPGARGSGAADLLSPSANRASSSSKGKAREPLAAGEVGQPVPVPRPGAVKMSNSARSTKHGSFDFERPGWGVLGIQRSGSGGTTGTTASGVSQAGLERHRERERESVYGPGLAGVGTLQRDASMKRGQEREEMLRLKNKARKVGLAEKERSRDRDKERDKEREKQRTRPSTSQRTTPQGSTTPSDPVHASTSTGASATAGKSSSLSRATGKRMKPSGMTRLVGLTAAHHGLFSFEPAVPSPTRSTGTASTGTAHEVTLPPTWAAKAEKERERVREEKERQRFLFKRRSGAAVGDRAPVPVPGVPPTYSSVSPTLNDLGGGNTVAAIGHTGSLGKSTRANPSAGHRSGNKGRSLDLGLGLAWAPSKVREEALLPSSSFFARTASGSSSNGMARTASGQSGRSGSGSATGTASGSASGLGRSMRTRGDRGGERDVERSKLGREVAEVFKSALDAEGYALFKSYVHQFDAHKIPFDGPTGILSLVENLLVSTPHLGDDGKRRLLDKFVRIICSKPDLSSPLSPLLLCGVSSLLSC